MIRIRSLPLALAVALTIGASAAHADDLMQVYQEARAADPTLAGAEATKLATDENVDQARSQLLPQIAASLDFTRTHGGDNGTSFVNVPTPDDPNATIPVDGITRTSYSRTLGAQLNQSILDISRWTALKASKYTANAGVTWNILQKYLVADATVRYWSSRYMDNDQSNKESLVPANATVDFKLSGEYRHFFWSLSVNNVLNALYYDYAIASAFTEGRFSAYPLPGRTYMLKAGATF